LSTWYPRKDIHKETWKIPGTKDANQIDHILVSKRWTTDIEMFEHTEELTQTLTISWLELDLNRG